MLSNTARRSVSVAALIAMGVYVAVICLNISSQRMMMADELNAWDLLTDPSWRHAFQSLNQGADSGTPLFYAIGRGLLAVTGPYPIAMRLYSALCFYLAAIIWAQILRRYFGDFIGIVAVCIAFVCNPEVLNEIPQVRFYGELIFGLAVAVRIAIWLQDSQRSTAAWFFFSALGGELLVASHPLGVTYSAAIVVSQLCTRSPTRKRIAMLIGTVVSWSYLLIFIGPVKNAADQDTWLKVPGLPSLLHFYDNTPLLVSRYRYATVLLNLILIALAAYAIVWFVRNRKMIQPRSLTVLFYITILLMLEPIGFVILSHLYKPVFLGRYLLPYSLGLVTLAASGAWLLRQRVGRRYQQFLAPIVVLSLISIAYFTLGEQYHNPISSLDPILQVAQSTPTVIEDDALVRQAHFYAPERSKNIFFVMAKPSKSGNPTILEIIADRGYAPSFVLDQTFFSEHRQFLYVAETSLSPFNSNDLQDKALWKSDQIGAVTVHGTSVPILEFTHR